MSLIIKKEEDKNVFILVMDLIWSFSDLCTVQVLYLCNIVLVIYIYIQNNNNNC